MATTVSRYDGSNELIEALRARPGYLEEEEYVWIVNGPYGRIPIIAKDEDDALIDYMTHERVYQTNPSDKN